MKKSLQKQTQLATVPKVEKKTRDIWDADTLFHALEVCEDERLKLAINLAFSCSLRIGELLGLTWDCVDISEESLAEGKASILKKSCAHNTVNGTIRNF